MIDRLLLGYDQLGLGFFLVALGAAWLVALGVLLARRAPEGGAGVGLSLDAFATLCAFAAVAFLAATMPMQNDSWWHLRLGQLLWELRGMPAEEPFAFTVPPGPAFPGHEWLAQVLFYGLYRLGGLPLLTLFAAALATGGTALCFSLMEGRPWVRALLLLAALPLLFMGWQVRGKLFTFLLLPATAWLVDRDRLAVLPLLFLAWANLHGGVTLGGAFMVVATLAAWSDRPRLARRAAATALSGLATLLTPLGPRIFTFPMRSVALSKAAGIQEFMSALAPTLAHGYFWGAAALFGLALAVGLRRHGEAARPRATLTAGALLFLALAFSIRRNIPLFTLLALPAGTRLVLTPGAPPGPRSRALLGLGGLVALGTALLVSWAWALPLPGLGWRPVSAEAAQAIRAAPDPTYCMYKDGGFLLWFVPGKRVFVDSRQDPYPEDFLLRARRVERSGDFAALFAEYGLRSAAIQGETPIRAALLAAGWRPTFDDGAWMVLAPPGPGR